MEKIRECILRLRRNMSVRKIAQELAMHRNLIRQVKRISIQKGWLESDRLMPDNSEIAKGWEKIHPQRVIVSPLDPYFEEIKRWHDEGYPSTVMHRLLQKEIVCSIYQIRRYLKKKFPKLIKPIMTRIALPSEVMDVDFGYLGLFWDKELQKMKKTWVFSGRLRYSRKAYRKTVTDQSVITFIMCHILAFEFFGGVPQTLVLDNLKSGVIKSTIDNDQINRSYREMAEHYNILLSPCLPRMPEHKGGVERDISYIKSSFLPLMKEKQRIYPHLDRKEIQVHLEEWDEEVANQRTIGGVGRTPFELFREEKTFLKALPLTRFDIPIYCQYTVGRSWKIMHNYIYYSVPYTLIGESVEVCVTRDAVRIFYKHQEVAFHIKGKEKWSYQKKKEHAPPLQEAVLNCNREGLLMKAEEIGKGCRDLTEKILSDPHLDKLRSIRSLLRLALKYSVQRLENACTRALHYNELKYSYIKNILENNLDQNPLEKEKKPENKTSFKHARSPQEYCNR